MITITGVVLIFSLGYIARDGGFVRFHLLVMTFVLSMVLLILSPNLVRALLGWDGLGLSSFLLVIYFQNRKSYNGGLLTVLSNRVGDVFMLLGARYFASVRGWNLYNCLERVGLAGGFYLVLAGITKRAQLPFCA